MLAARPAQLTAQHAHGAACDTAARTCVAAMTTALATHIRARDGSRTFTEGYLTQPMLLASLTLWKGRLHALGTFNFEGHTLRRGELNPGVYGEGYVDRRHPHTHLHEFMIGAAGSRGLLRASLVGGIGFVPFGSDDPMTRPFVKYPANHHLAQILERALVAGALRLGAVTVEVAAFNGDEPQSPTGSPNADRLFDSWAARGTVRTSFTRTAEPETARGAGAAWVEHAAVLEWSASFAKVKSPEDAAGFGLDQIKRAASLRFSGWSDSRDDRSHAGHPPRNRSPLSLRYALVEWAHTSESLGPRKNLWSFSSALAEGSVRTRWGDVSLRAERTTRPEEQRERSPFRSVRPLLDFGILGRTRWDIATIAWTIIPTMRGPGSEALLARLRVAPFVEVSVSRARPRHEPVIVSPEETFGGSRLLSLSAGVRLGAGSMRQRMGRYGAADGT